MNDTRAKILEAARSRIAADGVGGASLQEIADAAGVSKALLLYHFGDKAALLAQLARALTDAVLAREAAALDGATGAGAVDALWEWVSGELRRGDLRVLAALGTEGAPPVREALASAAPRRQEVTATLVARVFAQLGMRPRVAPPLLAEVVHSFTTGLALAARPAGADDQRVQFDVFWLAMLSLAE